MDQKLQARANNKINLLPQIVVKIWSPFPNPPVKFQTFIVSVDEISEFLFVTLSTLMWGASEDSFLSRHLSESFSLSDSSLFLGRDENHLDLHHIITIFEVRVVESQWKSSLNG